MLFRALVFLIVLSHIAAQSPVPSESNPGQQIIRVGTTYYTPLYAVNSAQILQAAESASLGIVRNPALEFLQAQAAQAQAQSQSQVPQQQSHPQNPQPTSQPGYKYEQPKRGYKYPAPTRPPPLAEQNPAEEEDRFATDQAVGVTPDRVAEFPTTPYPVGVETEQDIESVGITPEPKRPRPVKDQPSFEFPEDCPPDTADSWPCGYRSTIPGIEGIDYPIYSSIPKTQFRCSDYSHSGYFADLESRCQSFHVCLRRNSSPPKKFSFLCPNGTIFSQRDFVCTWWNEADDCSDSPDHYNLNTELNWNDITERTMMRMQTVRVRPTLPPAVQRTTLPAIDVRFRDDDIGANLVQVQRSKAYVTGKSNSRSQSLTKFDQTRSDSEAYEDKSIPAEGFIVNRRPTSAPNRVYTESQSSSGNSLSPTRPATTLLPRRPPTSTTPIQRPTTTTELPETDDYDFTFEPSSTLPPSREVYGPPNYVPSEPQTSSPNSQFDQELTSPQDLFISTGPPKVTYPTSTTRAAATAATSKPRLNYVKNKNSAQTFNSNDSETIDEILNSSNIVDPLPNGAKFNGFSQLGTQSQLFNSNIRDLLKSKGRVQEVRPEFVEYMNATDSDSNAVEPVRTALSAQENQQEQQALNNEPLSRAPAQEVENSLPRESLYKADGKGILKAMPIPAQPQSTPQPGPQPGQQQQFQQLPHFFPTFQVQQHPMPLFQAAQPQFFQQIQQIPPQPSSQFLPPAPDQQPQEGSSSNRQAQSSAPQAPPNQPQPQQPQLTNQYLPPAQNAQPLATMQRQVIPQYTQFVVQPPPQHHVFPQYAQIMQPIHRQVLQPYFPPPSPPTLNQAYGPPPTLNQGYGAPTSPATLLQPSSYQAVPAVSTVLQPVEPSAYNPVAPTDEPGSGDPSHFSPEYSSQSFESSPPNSESFSDHSAPSYPNKYTPSVSTYSSPTIYSSSPPRYKNSKYLGPIRNFLQSAFRPPKPQFHSRPPPPQFFSSSAPSKPTYLPPSFASSSKPQFNSESNYFPPSSSFSSSGSEADFGDQFIEQTEARPVVVSSPSPSVAPVFPGAEVVPAVGLHFKTVVSGGRSRTVQSPSTQSEHANSETLQLAESTNSFRVFQPLQNYNQHNIPAASLERFLPCQAGSNKVCPNEVRLSLLPQQAQQQSMQYPVASYQPQPLKFTPISNNVQGYSTISSGVNPAKLLVAIPTPATPLQQYNPVGSYQQQSWTKITPGINNGQGYTNGVNAAKLLIAVPTQASPSFHAGGYAPNQLQGSLTHYDRTKELLAHGGRGQSTHYNGSRGNQNIIVHQPIAVVPIRQIPTHRGNVPVHNAGTKQHQEQQVSYGFKPNVK